MTVRRTGTNTSWVDAPVIRSVDGRVDIEASVGEMRTAMKRASVLHRLVPWWREANLATHRETLRAMNERGI